MRARRAGMTRRRNREVVELADVHRQRADGKVTFDGHITARQTVRSSVT